MKRAWLLLVLALAILTGCGTSTQPSPPLLSAEQQARVAAEVFATSLKQEYGYNTVSSDIDDEEADKAKKKGKAKATKTPASSKAPAKSAAPGVPSSSKASTTSTTVPTANTVKKIYVLEVIFEERGCRWEAQKKLGDTNFKIDETTDKAGEEIDVNFDAVSPKKVQFLAWVDLPENRVKFDCYVAA